MGEKPALPSGYPQAAAIRPVDSGATAGTKLPKIRLNSQTKELAGFVQNAQIPGRTAVVRRLAMNISGVTGVAAAFEGARVAGQQQASATANAAQTQRENDQQAQEVDLKKTETVTQDQGTSGSGDAGERRLNIVV